MKSNLRKLLTVSFISLGVTVAAINANADVTMKICILGKAKVCEVKANQLFKVITEDRSASTGYVPMLSYLNKCAYLVDVKPGHLPLSQDIVGMPATKIFFFQAVPYECEKDHLGFVNKRIWEDFSTGPREQKLPLKVYE